VEHQIVGGGNLADALAKYPKYFTATFVALVRAGEASGTLDQVVTMLREYVAAGADLITLRPTSWDQEGQVRILIEQVLPALKDVAVHHTPAGMRG